MDGGQMTIGQIDLVRFAYVHTKTDILQSKWL